MSAIEFELSELEIDALTELVNLGVSRAAVSLREMVQQQVHLSVPAVAIVSRARAADLVAERRTEHLIAVRQAFDGEFSGRALLIFPESNSLELVRIVAGEHLSFEDILELEHEALGEIGNIILNACIATIANLLERSLRMSLPEIVRGVGPEFFELPSSSPDDVVMFIHINFSLRGHQVSGYLALVMDLPSLAVVKTLVSAFIARTAG